MALSFPLSRTDFQNQLRIASTTPFRLQRLEETSGVATGDIITKQVAPPKWIAQMTLARMPFSEASGVLSLLDSLGTSNRVHLYDPTCPYPRADPGGAGLGDADAIVVVSIGANNRSLRITGLPVGYVLSRGDMISIGYGSPTRRWLGRIAETVAANAAGQTPLFEVAPHIPAGLQPGDPVTLKRPHGVFVITGFASGQAAKRDDGHHVTGVEFSAIQVPK